MSLVCNNVYLSSGVCVGGAAWSPLFPCLKFPKKFHKSLGRFPWREVSSQKLWEKRPAKGSRTRKWKEPRLIVKHIINPPSASGGQPELWRLGPGHLQWGPGWQWQSHGLEDVRGLAPSLRGPGGCRHESFDVCTESLGLLSLAGPWVKACPSSSRDVRQGDPVSRQVGHLHGVPSLSVGMQIARQPSLRFDQRYSNKISLVCKGHLISWCFASRLTYVQQ